MRALQKCWPYFIKLILLTLDQNLAKEGVRDILFFFQKDNLRQLSVKSRVYCGGSR